MPVYRTPSHPRPPALAPALLFPTIAATVISLTAAAVSVAGQAAGLIARFAENLKRFAVTLNDING